MSGVVIKAGDTRVGSRGLYSLDLRDIAGQADAMLSEARSEGARIVAETRQRVEAERETVRRAAYREGYEQGLARGAEAGRAAALEEARQRLGREQASLVSALQSLAEAFRAQREKLYLAARRDVVVLAIAIARRIAGNLDGMAGEAAAEACREALELIGGATEAVVRAHPDDRQALETLAQSLSKAMQSPGHLRLVEDASVGRGGVVVETGDCTVDARAAARVERIANELVADWRERTKALALEQ